MKKDILTPKGLFERLVRLEAKMDILQENSFKTTRKFTFFVYILFFVEIFNLFLNYILVSEHDKLELLVKSLIK